MELRNTRSKGSSSSGIVRQRTNLHGKKYAANLSKIFPPTPKEAVSREDVPDDMFSPRVAEGTRFIQLAPDTALFKRAMKIKKMYTH